MKKNLKSLILLIMAIIISVVAVGCGVSFVDDDNGGDTDGGNTPGGGDTTVVFDDSVLGGTLYTNLPSSMELSSNVSATYGSKQEEYKSRAEVVSAISRSAVSVWCRGSVGTSKGSGVVVDLSVSGDDADVFYIVTCHHVITRKGDLTVYFPDAEGDNYDSNDYDKDYVLTGKVDNKIHNDQVVTLVGGDVVSDIAVLKVDFGKHETKVNDVIPSPNKTLVRPVKAQISNRKLAIGDEVIAIGNSLGEHPGHTSYGQISYLERDVSVSDVGKMKLIELDMNTYPGNSGGGLYNMYGELIGITNAGNGDNAGINFAIPANVATDKVGVNEGFESIAKQLIATKTATNFGYISGRWQLGVTPNQTTQGDTYVYNLVDGSNAKNAGVMQNDIITKVAYNAGGKDSVYAITDASSFAGAMLIMRRELKTGDSFVLTVRRSGSNGGIKNITVALTNQSIFCDTGVYA